MAQYFTDFSDQTASTFPTGWTGRITQTTDWEIISAPSPHGKAIASTTGSSTRKAITWDTVGTSADVEVYYEFGSNTGSTLGDRRIALRLDTSKNTSSATAHLYTVGYRHPDNYAGKYVNGSFTEISTAAESPNPGFTNEADVYACRVRISGSAIKVRIWDKSGSEPGTWDLETTDTSIAGAGAVGLFSFDNSTSTYVSAFGVGTGGDSAPTSEVGGGPTYTLTAAKGSYAITGKAAALSAARKLTAAKGSYAYTGYAAGLSAGRKLIAAKGSYSLTGQDSTLKASRKLVADKGSYALTGQDATLKAARVLTAEKGGYSLTGYAATLTYTPVSGPTYTLTAAKGSYALTGYTANLRASRVLTADNGSYALSGYSATLSYSGDAAEDAWTFAGGPFSGAAFSGEQIEAIAAVNDTVTLSAVSDIGSLVALTTVEAEIFTALTESTDLQALVTTGFSDPRPFFWPTVNGYQVKPLVDPLDQMHFLTVGTDTAKQVAADVEFTQIHTNPVKVDRFGNIPAVFVDSASEYRFILKNRYGVTKWEAGSYTWPNTIEDHLFLSPITETNTLAALTTSEP